MSATRSPRAYPVGSSLADRHGSRIRPGVRFCRSPRVKGLDHVSVQQRRGALHQYRVHRRMVGWSSRSARILTPVLLRPIPAERGRYRFEAGVASARSPQSGPVVSNIYVLIPLGFSPPETTLQCGARCIDQPRTMDLSQAFSGMGADAVLGSRSFVIEEAESFQSTWWPVVLVGVNNLDAWNTIVAAKTITAVDDCQTNGGCLPEVETNAFLFFQVLGPGMSPQGPD